jgi:steroid C-25 hydroxylase gamma subunit
MQARKLDATSEELLNPSSSRWTRVKGDMVSLEGTPVQLQPSRYIRAKWSDRPTGTVRALKVRSAHNGRQIFFHLEWQDDELDDGKSGSSFPDAAGILFPLNGDAPLQTMGAPKAPVNAWYWRADDESPRNVVATGVGTATHTDGGALVSQASWNKGTWRVVIGRSLRAPRNTQAVAIKAGSPTKVAFAIWEGGQEERGGIKSFSNGWQELTLAK